ncbi:MAG: hypothetical protein IT184_00895 [Acidobacteria bacterium]|nr:hypothetical protein [Acidobacteriota bacterium]
MIRRWSRMAGLLIAFAMPASAAHAQVVQSIHFGLGGFFPKGLDARSNTDVIRRNIRGEFLPADLTGDPTVTDALAIRVQDFRGAQAFGEWVVAFGPNVEVSAGLGIYSRNVPSVYRDLIDDRTLGDIEQTIKLRMVPLTAMVRFLPFGNASTVQPYVGVGVSAIRFRYSEFGDFVDPETLVIHDNDGEPYAVSGWTPGTVFVYGLRIPVGGDIYALSIEGRHQFAEGKTGGAESGFVADKIDLGGANLNVGFVIRF